ncbi:HPr family phosphocarrier protein [Cellulomonas sp. APG4]|nr:HPr family phosphocarrier protein [Cellulomonas sp. APG4]
MTVGLVLVSHAAAAAEGAAQIARQMAPDVLVLPAGGAHGGIGTDVDVVVEAIGSALETVAGVVVLTDLGSAVMSAETALELLEAESTGGADAVRVPSAPFVEGAVAAAVEAQQGGDLAAVERAAVGAGRMFAPEGPASDARGDGGPQTPSAVAPEAEVHRARAVLAPGVGLHARPAALLARAVAEMPATVRVGGANATSVLELMALGASGGAEVEVEASGDGAAEAVAEVVRLLEGDLEQG